MPRQWACFISNTSAIGLPMASPRPSRSGRFFAFMGGSSPGRRRQLHHHQRRDDRVEGEAPGQEMPITEPAPQALTDKVNEFGAERCSMALQLANARMAADREALEADRVQMEAHR
jgi:hypothetical protein